jgi:hypothetical protein
VERASRPHQRDIGKTSYRKWHGELSQKLLGELVPIIYKGLKATA